MLEDFTPHKNGKHGRYYQCRTCKSVADKEYYNKNSEKVKARVREYQLSDPEREKAWQQERYKNNRSHRLANAKRWAQDNKEKVRGYKRGYQARLEGLKKAQNHNPDYDKILDRDGLTCYLCNGSIDKGDHQYDHIVPITKDGAHAEFNISIAHSTCNIRKQATLPEDLSEPRRSNALNKLKELEKGYRE